MELSVGVNIQAGQGFLSSAIIHVPRLFLSEDSRRFPVGGYWKDDNSYGIFVEITLSHAALLSATIGGVDWSSGAYIYVYYR